MRCTMMYDLMWYCIVRKAQHNLCAYNGCRSVRKDVVDNYNFRNDWSKVETIERG